MNLPVFIAEVKTKSPFGFQSQKSWGELFSIANEYGDIISIHTDSRWGGSLELLKYARKRAQKQILAKGIHTSDDDIRRAFDAGADFVLVVGRVPNMSLENIIIEPHSLGDLADIPEGTKVLWNARNLATGEPKKETFDEARRTWRGWLCQGSFIKTPQDIKAGADAILIGTYLAEYTMALRKN